jgi:hypothetical protein
LDASYDWHVLLIAPIGSALKDVPATMHEVLLFRDEAHSAAAADELECFAVDSKPPRFAGRAPDEYLLCFKQDRLTRIEATVRLPAEEAAKYTPMLVDCGRRTASRQRKVARGPTTASPSWATSTASREPQQP